MRVGKGTIAVKRMDLAIPHVREYFGAERWDDVGVLTEVHYFRP